MSATQVMTKGGGVWVGTPANQYAKLRHRLKKSLPQAWQKTIDDLKAKPLIAGCTTYLREVPRHEKNLEALQAFADKYGDALAWSMGDGDICELAKRIAEDARSAMDVLYPDAVASLVDRLVMCEALTDAVGVDMPKAIEAVGAVNRVRCADWWRRVLRRAVARVTELGAIDLGLVQHSSAGAVYASDAAVARRADQLRRNEETLKKRLMRNEAGQVYTLAELASLSVANRDVRRGELMTRIRGAEEYAVEHQHAGVFVTLTCPSEYHARKTIKSGGKVRSIRNSKYAGHSPKDAQTWLCKRWARVRSAMDREGLMMYGLRVAEPHHDACPHWHGLFWLADVGAAARFEALLKKHWSDDVMEVGADKYRVKVKAMIGGKAAGYVAKYIAKNIDSSHDVGSHLDNLASGEQLELETGKVTGAARVDAWAATWGIRQFQAVGMPPIGLWRTMRAVSRDQVTDRDAIKAARAAHDCVHRVGDAMADFCGFVKAVGGMCRGAGGYALKIARDVREQVNGYGETVFMAVTVGIEDLRGRLYVSKRQAWGAVVGVAAQTDAQRRDLSRPWTGFNNCTARIDVQGFKKLFGEVIRPLYDSFDADALRWKPGDC